MMSRKITYYKIAADQNRKQHFEIVWFVYAKKKTNACAFPKRLEKYIGRIGLFFARSDFFY
jgi:hypothetical protein